MATIIRQFIYRQDRKVSWKGDHHRILRLGTQCVPDLRILLLLPIQAFAGFICLLTYQRTLKLQENPHPVLPFLVLIEIVIKHLLRKAHTLPM